MNSAQHGTVYSIEVHTDHKDVHLWGIDSFWSTDLESRTDAYVRPNQKAPRVKPRITRQWNGYWHKIFSSNSDRNFLIHKPITKSPSDKYIDHENVRVVEEEK